MGDGNASAPLSSLGTSSWNGTSERVRLPAALARRLALPRAIARKEGNRIFLVGGAVRDLLLGRSVADLDFAVEGDAVALARKVGESLNAPVRVHGRFGTATVELAAGGRLDFAATRREKYERSGALPTVAPAGIEEDLFRRDFTVNAMALEVAPGRRPSLHDPYSGREDLCRRRLRVLHSLSFRDDPTRAYRAARYANRLGFSVERSTRRALIKAIREGALETISGDRRRRELRLLLSEPDRAGGVRWLARLGLLTTLHPALAAGARTLSRLRQTERLEPEARWHAGWFLYLLVWAAELSKKETRELAERLSLTGEEGRIFRSWPATQQSLSHRLPRACPSAIAELGLGPEETMAAAVCSPRREIRALLRRSISAEPIDLAIRGRDLIRFGVAPGPVIGRALERTLAARRDGKISREEELEFALKAAKERS